MNAKVTISIMFVLLAATAFSQQTNYQYCSMTINGVDGAPWPILTNCRTSTAAIFTFLGATNQPYAVFQGPLQTGAAAAFGDIIDLQLNPFPALPINGYLNPVFSTDVNGTSAFSVTLPNAGTPPTGIALGFQIAVQAVMSNPFSPFGYSLSAATRVTVTQGPTITFYSLGDEGTQALSTAGMPLPFYGTNYTTLHLNSNGYICFGTNTSDFTPSDVEFNSGPPMMAGMWSDLDCPPSAVKVTVDTPQSGGTIPGYVKVEYTNVSSWTAPIYHNFSFLIQTDGYLEVISPTTNNPSLYDSITGIGPGSNIGVPQSQKNFVGTQPTGSTVGNGILTSPPFSKLGNVNENFFEWFGILTQHQYYGNTYNNPFDLLPTTLHFQVSGSGTLPASTNRYTLY